MDNNNTNHNHNNGHRGSAVQTTDSFLYEYSDDDDGSARSGVWIVGGLGRGGGSASSSSVTSGPDRYFFDDGRNDSDDDDVGSHSSPGGSSLDGDRFYIFTDDDESPSNASSHVVSGPQSLVHRATLEEVGAMSHRACATEPALPPPLLVLPDCGCPTLTPPSLNTPSAIDSPTEWGEYHRRRGKLVAQQLLLRGAAHTMSGGGGGGSNDDHDSEILEVGAGGGGVPTPPRQASSVLRRLSRPWASSSPQRRNGSAASPSRSNGRAADATADRPAIDNPVPPPPPPPSPPRATGSLVGSWDDCGGKRLVVAVAAPGDTTWGGGLDGRPRPDDLVELFRLGDEGRELLRDLRSQCGEVSLDGCRWHVPRYDAYVAAAVRALKESLRPVVVARSPHACL